MCQPYKQSSGLYLQAPLYIYNHSHHQFFRVHIICWYQFIQMNFRKCLRQQEQRVLQIRFRQLQNRRMIIFHHITAEESKEVSI